MRARPHVLVAKGRTFAVPTQDRPIPRHALFPEDLAYGLAGYDAVIDEIARLFCVAERSATVALVFSVWRIATPICRARVIAGPCLEELRYGRLRSQRRAVWCSIR